MMGNRNKNILYMLVLVVSLYTFYVRALNICVGIVFYLICILNKRMFSVLIR